MLVLGQRGGLVEPPDFALLWDFASICQPPWADAREQALFNDGLEAATALWCGHAHSTCWMQSTAPEGFTGVLYDSSGWTFVESAISAVVKPGAKRLDLGLRTDAVTNLAADSRACYSGGYFKPAYRLDTVCTARRAVPRDGRGAMRRDGRGYPFYCKKQTLINQSFGKFPLGGVVTIPTWIESSAT